MLCEQVRFSNRSCGDGLAKLRLALVSIFSGLATIHFLSFTCYQHSLSRGNIDFPKFGTDKQINKQTDGQTAVFVELLRN